MPARRLGALWFMLAIAAGAAGACAGQSAAEAAPEEPHRMPPIAQLIRGKDASGRWWYVVTPMTSRVIPATAVVADGERHADLAALIAALRARPAPLSLYLALPGWFGAADGVLEALSPADQTALAGALRGTRVEVHVSEPPR